MYNVKGPSMIVAKTTRRGMPQNMENIREYTRNKSVEHEDVEIATVPKPVFLNKKSPPYQHQQGQECISPQHEEIINFINDSWNKIHSEVCEESPNGYGKGKRSLYYKDKPITLEGFKRFDFESWWGKHVYACITGSNNGNKN